MCVCLCMCVWLCVIECACLVLSMGVHSSPVHLALHDDIFYSSDSLF